NSVLALRISVIGDDEGGSRGGRSACCMFTDSLDVTSIRSRLHRPVPGIVRFLYTPRGPTFTLRGAAPRVALRPCRVKFSFTQGNTLKVFRNRQLIENLPGCAGFLQTQERLNKAQPHSRASEGCLKSIRA